MFEKLVQISTDKIADKGVGNPANELILGVSSNIIPRITEEVFEKISDKVVNEIYDKVAAKVSNEVIEKVSDKVVDKVTQQASDEIAKKVLELLPDAKKNQGATILNNLGKEVNVIFKS